MIDEKTGTELDLYKQSEVALSTVCVSGHRLPVFTDIKTCTEECPIFERCVAQNVGKLCVVEKNYLGHIIKAAVKSLPKPVSEEVLQRIGLVMLPLYSDLFRFQLEKSALASVMLGKGVTAKIHPIFRVIRETISIIDTQWTRIGYSKLAIKQIKGIGEKEFINGDADYYESIST